MIGATLDDAEARRVPNTCATQGSQRCLRWSRHCGGGSVKPSATPSVVRIHHLPHPAKTAPWLRFCGYAGRFFSVPWCVTLGRCGPLCCGIHGRIPGTASGRQDGRCNRRFSTDGHGLRPQSRTNHGQGLRGAGGGLTFAAERSVHIVPTDASFRVLGPGRRCGMSPRCWPVNS